MTFQVCDAGEPHAATATKSLLTGVPRLVRNQRFSIRKRRVAVLAFKALFFCVRPEMHLDLSRCPEALSTHLTREVQLTRVNSLVRFLQFKRSILSYKISKG